MNTAAAPIKDFSNIVAQPRPHTAQDDPRAIKWGYGAGLFQMAIPALQSGQQTGMVEQGVFVPFDNFKIAADSANLENHRQVAIRENGQVAEVATDEYEVSAWEAIYSVKQAFGSQDNRKGFIELEILAGNRDGVMLGAIEYIVNPSFKDIIVAEGEQTAAYRCPEGLDVCPTCRLEILDGLTEQRIAAYAAELGVDPDLCRSVAARLRSAVVDLLDFYNGQWSAIKGDLETAKTGAYGLKRLFPEHTYIRQCLHESAPEERQAQIQSAYAETIGNQLAHSQRENAVIFADALNASRSDDKMLAMLEQMQQNQAKQDERFMALMEKIIPPTQDAQSEQPQPAAKNGNKK